MTIIAISMLIIISSSSSSIQSRLTLGSFASQDFGICLRSFGADSLSPQISAILLVILHGKSQSPQISAKLSAKLSYKTRADRIANPGSRASAAQTPRQAPSIRARTSLPLGEACPLSIRSVSPVARERGGRHRFVEIFLIISWFWHQFVKGFVSIVRAS